MSNFEGFTNLFSMSKTLRFKLIPVGKTMENFSLNKILEQDSEKAEYYKVIKKLMDEYHKDFIERVLSNVYLDISEYAEIYEMKNKTEKEKKQLEDMEKSFRKKISDAFTNNKEYKEVFGKEMIEDILPKYYANHENAAQYKRMFETFKGFNGYFNGLYQARGNMYVADDKSTAIANRCINQNLPRFIDNSKSYERIEEVLKEQIEELNDNLYEHTKGAGTKLFSVDCFSQSLSQSGIDLYNLVIGGLSGENGTKIKGLNEYVNLYNQTAEKNQRLPLFKKLYKQILSDAEGFSFVVEKFDNDYEMMNSVREYYKELEKEIPQFKNIFSNFKSYDFEGIYYSNNAYITKLSQQCAGDWSLFKKAWNEEYELRNPLSPKTKKEKYDEKREKEYKNIGSFSMSEVCRLLPDIACPDEFITSAVLESINQIKKVYSENSDLFEREYEKEKRLMNNDKAVEKIKGLLDSIKLLQNSMKPLLGTGKEEYKDNAFYAEFLAIYDFLSMIDKLYNKVRNYLTQKPYSTDKIKLNFENGQLLNGWDKNKESAYYSVMIRKNGKYYLAIMAKNNNHAFESIPECAGECYEKMEYKLLPGPNKMLPKVFFSKKNIDLFNPSTEIGSIRERESFKKGDNFNLDDCHKLIDFYKESISKHEDWSKFGFVFKPTKEYQDIGEFYKDVKNQGYSVKFVNVGTDYINKMVDEGSLYLFQIYNKDFSENSKGTPNLHTMYFKQLFDEDNLKDVVYKLNGEAEIFYRKGSIRKEDRTIHKAGDKLENKNPDNPKKYSKFEYDIIKDKRFTDYQFSFHVPITMNFQADSIIPINEKVRQVLSTTKENYVIGIDRGERNLLYVCVVNSSGQIVEQYTMNTIENQYNDVKLSTNYRALLDKKEQERLDARREWASIEGIKDLKAGYLSQVVHKISELVQKYDAIVCLEDLNGGFKNSRTKVENQVYQKLENAMIDKFSYLLDKKKSANELGGINKALQLATVDLKGKGLQNGIVFYVSPWLTSKIDPCTGFVNILNTRYSSVENARQLISNIDSIGYVEKEDLFKYDIDFSKFEKGTMMSKKKWSLYSYGNRIKTFRNPEKNNAFDNVEIDLTEEFKKLFDMYGIPISGSMKDSILAQEKKEFFEKFMHLLSLMLQMRNSITGDVDVDYLISPVKNKDGIFFDSRKEIEGLPLDADANGAYHIALKGLLAIDKIKEAENQKNVKLAISNIEWLEFTQNRF